MRKKTKRILAFVLFLSVCASFVAGCSSGGDSVIIGSKDFTESILVSEMYAQLLEANGIPVERKQALGGTPIIHEAMMANELNLYPEYTSTGIATVLKEEPLMDPQAAFEKVKAGYAEQYNMVWLDMTDVNNSQGMAITKEAADAYGIRTLTDLSQQAPNLRLAATAEFEEREDGLMGLKQELGGFDFQEVTVYDKGIKYEVLRNGSADVNVCFTTDADLSKGDIIAIEDDAQFWPPYYLAPVIRHDTLEQHPELEGLLNQLSAVLTTPVMQQLNARVDIDQEEYSAVAQDFLTEQGLIG